MPVVQILRSCHTICMLAVISELGREKRLQHTVLWVRTVEAEAEADSSGYDRLPDLVLSGEIKTSMSTSLLHESLPRSLDLAARILLNLGAVTSAG